MNALTKEFFGDGFNVLGFPCNNFNLQEPGANAAEILSGLAWVRPGNGYVPAFQMFKKIDVNGQDEHKLYTYLKNQCGPTSDQFQGSLHYDPKKVSDVRWNFEIFLVNKTGVPIYRYSPDHDVMSIVPDIRGLIGVPVQSALINDDVTDKPIVDGGELQHADVEDKEDVEEASKNVDEMPKIIEEAPKENESLKEVEDIDINDKLAGSSINDEEDD